ncbi:MAG: glycogen/starch/alpha-glucan phosphorylase [Planctomycetes bacterium]|nr:glycogen/starch/alpha-glucan phosphorylase [Planctomycetota bacterium]
MDAMHLRDDIFRHLSYTLGRDSHSVSNRYRYSATALAVRDRLMERWKATHAAYYHADCRRGYYLSLEFLMGRALGNAILNLGMPEEAKQALRGLGQSLEDVIEEEADAGLGNGGLGRLAACFLDSCATLSLPVYGYGIRYDYGMFRQRIINGAQVEEPDHWLAQGTPWEMQRPEYAQRVMFNGHTEFYKDSRGRSRVRWTETHDVLAIPYDVPIPGYRNGTVNTLRLWSATSTQHFNLADFNAGDYAGAVEAKSSAEHISRVLYPNDKSENGKELRLRQQYFLASASLQDILRRWTNVHGQDFKSFAAKNVCQLNDTHPTVAVAELMRLLMDEYTLGWDEAWLITTRCMAYTNHTLLPEALEKWSVGLFRALLPRILEIIYEINARFMRVVANKWPGDTTRQARMSIIEDGTQPHVRMAYLAIVGSFSVNGVAALHSDLLKNDLFRDFNELWPERFNNKTNGVTQRRWLAMCNPRLAELITKTIGDSWVTELSDLGKLAAHVNDGRFRNMWRDIKLANKQDLAAVVKRETGVEFPVDAMFDVHVKRIHEYKRQLLNALHVIHLYDRIKRGDTKNWTKRAVLFGGKAAPGYAMAKSIIKFINNVAEVVNSDPAVKDLLRVAFLPDYRVSQMEKITPAADLSEQISTAGKEASGTGNMKFMMNGALTIGTLDGANIEIREEVGDKHFFLFGKTTDEIAQMRRQYDPAHVIEADPQLKRVLALIKSGHFNQVEPGIFDDIINSLTIWGDYWMICADFADYVRAQNEAAAAYQDVDRWTASSILNTAHSGKFSTDRTMREYNRDIWKMEPVRAIPV